MYGWKLNMEEIQFKINKTLIGKNYPTYFIAELSCNHNQDKSIAKKLIYEAFKSEPMLLNFKLIHQIL